MRHRVHKSLNCLDKVTATEIVNEVKQDQRDTEFEINTLTKVIFFQESLHILLLVYLVLFVNEVAHLWLLLMLGHE